eukprot:2157-Amphidinium_carterae.2
MDCRRTAHYNLLPEPWYTQKVDTCAGLLPSGPPGWQEPPNRERKRSRTQRYSMNKGLQGDAASTMHRLQHNRRTRARRAVVC